MLTYLLRCNTDTTSLLSGTAIKAAIAYITDYISKSSLKTHVIFETIKIILSNADQILGSILSRSDQGRRLLTKLVNSLIGKMEIGAPMASMYLLGNPDHYTDQNFINFHWRSYINEVIRTSFDDDHSQSLIIGTQSSKAVSRPMTHYSSAISTTSSSRPRSASSATSSTRYGSGSRQSMLRIKT